MEKESRHDLPCLVFVSLVAQAVKCLPAMWETQVQPLDWEDTLEKEMATHSSTLAWKIHGQRSLVSYSPWGHKELVTTERLHFASCFLLLPTHSILGISPLKSPPQGHLASPTLCLLLPLPMGTEAGMESK